MPEKTHHRVKVGSVSLDIYRRTDPKDGEQWRFSYYKPGEHKRRHGTYKSLKKAKERANEIALKISQGVAPLENLTPNERTLCETLLESKLTLPQLHQAINYIKAAENSSTLEKTIPEFIERQIVEAKNKIKTPHIAQQERDLNNIAKFIGSETRLTSITTKQLHQFIIKQEVGAKRHNGLRATLTKYFSFLRTHEYIPNEAETAAHKIPRANEYKSSEIRVYQPEETIFILQHTTEEFLPWNVLCGLSGLRPEEISPKKTTPKDPLTTEALDFENNKIWVKRSHAKGKKPKPRSMPMLPACKAWLIHCGLHEGPVRPICSRNAAEAGETLRLGKLMDKHFKREEGWVRDGLRHAYGSFRNALIKDLPRLSEEMGNSVQMLHDHYHEPQPLKPSKEHFAITPDLIFSEKV